MGLLDRYRQFEGMSEAEVNAELRERAAERKRLALARVEPLDLSRTTWPELPHPNVVAAITYAARRGLNRYADRDATALRHELAACHDLPAQRIAVGNGAAQLIGSAALARLGPGDELLTPWPSYPLYPLLAARSKARAVPVPAFEVDALLDAVTERTRLLTLCNPNDPTGARLGSRELARLADALPEHVALLVDEALADAVDAEPPDAVLRALAGRPRTAVLRTFSKLWGLAGLRVGYAAGDPELLEAMRPELGVGELGQVAALEALRTGGAEHERRRSSVVAQRARLLDRLQRMHVDVHGSQANVLWLAAPGLSGGELAARLERHGATVQPGGALGARDRVRVAVQDEAAASRFLHALEQALAGR